MKKVFSLLSLALMVLAFASCSSSPSAATSKKATPEDVVKEYITLLQNGKFEKAVDMLSFKKEISAEDKAELVKMVQEKVTKEYEKKKGIAGVEDITAEIAEDGNSAKVNYVMKFGDGTTKKEKGKLVKVDDVWKVDSGK